MNVYEFFENLEHVPGAMLYAGEDELVNYQQGEAARMRFAELVLPHVFYFHPAADHFTFLAADDWAKEAAWSSGRAARARPAHVRYRAEPWVDNPALDIRHDRAYWVHDIVGRGAAEDEYFDVELTSSGCGGEHGCRSRSRFPLRRETIPSRGPRRRARATGQTALPRRTGSKGISLNVVSVGVDGTIAGACIDPATPLAYHLTTDGPVELTISGYRHLDAAECGHPRGRAAARAGGGGRHRRRSHAGRRPRAAPDRGPRYLVISSSRVPSAMSQCTTVLACGMHRWNGGSLALRNQHSNHILPSHAERLNNILL